MTTPAPPKATSQPRTTGAAAAANRSTGASNGTAAAAATATFTGVQGALQSVQQLKATVGQLEHELQGYADPNVVGRDTILLRSFFDQSVGRLMQIAQACKINWTPPANTPRSGR